MATKGPGKSTRPKESPIIATKKTPEGVTITAKTGSIITEKVDVLINTTQRELTLNSGTISKLISQAAGPALQKECDRKAPRGIDYGQFVDTAGGKLPCKAVYHCVVSKWKSGEGEKTLRSALSQCLHRAHKDNRSSMAMPAIGTGNLGFPIQKVSAIISEEVQKFSKNNRKSNLKDVRIVVLPSESDMIQALKTQLLGKPAATVSYKQAVTTGRMTLAGRILPARSRTKEGIVVTVKAGSVIEEKVDVIINSTSKDLNLTAGVISSAILKAAGGNMQDECLKQAPDGLTPGGIVETGGGRLSCKTVYHGPVPPWNSGDGEKGLRAFIRSTIQWADEAGMTTMAIPPIGTGKLKYPRDAVAKAIFEEIREHSANNPSTTLNDIRLVLFDETMEAVVAFTSQLKLLNTSQALSDDDDDPDEMAYKSRLPLPESTASVASSVQTPEGINVILKLGSIIGEKVTVITNVVGKDVQLTKGTLSKLLLEAAGDVIQRECTTNAPSGLDYGQLVESSGGQLDCRYIYHCCLTMWRNGDGKKYLHEVLETILKQAHQNNITSLALPAMGTGILQFPPDAVVKAMLQEITDFSQIHTDTKLKEVRIVVHDKEKACVQAFKSHIDDMKAQTMVIGPNTEQHITAQSIQPLPNTWNMMDMDSPSILIPLTDSDPEYRQVAEEFVRYEGKDTPVGQDIMDSIVQVQRIQNPLLYEMYSVLRRQTERRNKDKTAHPVERILYHGTTEKALENINSRGFNRSYCGRNSVDIGEGVYFALKSSVAREDKFASPDDNGYKYIYQTRVLTGEYTKGSYSCVEPPIKNQARNIRYDSVVDNDTKPEVFVIFYDAQAYPEYLITITQ